MGRPRVAPLVLVCMLSACTNDFDAFEPGADAGAAGDDASGPEAATDAASKDGAPSDAAAEDSLPIDAPSDVAATCSESGAITFNGHCYFLTTASGSWDESRATCSAAGAHLVTIASSAEQGTVETLAPTSDRWIGLSRPVGSSVSDTSYVWITGEPRTYTNWGYREPNGSGECVRFSAGGRWSDNACATTLAAICERE